MATLVRVGQSAGHVEGRAKVTGSGQFAADILLPGLLWAKCLRSPFPHARIRSIDASRAKRLPGVRAIITGGDVPEVRLGRFVRDMPILARDRVRFIGEKVAAIAAESPEIAEEALTLIDVEFEELPAVFDPLEAMKGDAPRLHDDPAAYEHLPIPDFMHGDSQIGPAIPNVLSRVVLRHGDPEAGFAQADHISEHTFLAQAIHQGYVEPHACVVQVEPEGKVNVWLSNKTPFLARGQIAAGIGVPEEQVRLNPVFIGGDFGGKGDYMDAVVCYYLAEKTGSPIKLVMTYTEELLAGNPRHTSLLTLRTGVNKEGQITARQAKMVFDTGAYSGMTPIHALHGAYHVGGAYRVPHLELEAIRVYTNSVPRGHMRSPGAPQVLFAVECHTDMIANELGLDPLEFRLRNALAEGDIGPLGERWHDIRCKDALVAAADAIGWGTEKPRNVGRGIAVYDRPPGSFGPSSATLSIDDKARITLLIGGAETGTGYFTIMQQVVAEELQVPLESITVVQGDTDTATFEVGASGSRLTHTAGQAALAAARELMGALTELAARLMGCEPEQVQLKDGHFLTSTGHSLEMAELMARAAEQGEAPITRTGNYLPRGSGGVNSFHAQAAEVEIDPETGQVKLRRLVTAHDVGTVINPLTHQGQIEGGVAFGIGQALIERLDIEEGSVSTLNLGDYKLPTAADMPELTTILIETKAGPAPYEGKAIGEMSNVAVPAAIANAVFDAAGVRLTELPITAEKIHAALQGKGQVP